MNAFPGALAAWLIDFYALASVLLTASLVARFFIRQPQSRVLLAWGTWLGAIALAGLAAVPAWPRHDVIGLLTRPALQLPTRGDFAGAVAPPPVDTPRGSDLPGEASKPKQPLALQDRSIKSNDRFELSSPDCLAGLWLSAAMLAILWMGVGALQAWRVLRCAAEAPPWAQQELARVVGLKHNLPGLWSSPKVSTAVALGAVRPHIVLPSESLQHSNTPAVRAAIAHEWAHIRHGDLWLLVAERLVLALLFPHPLVWWLRRGVRLDLELAADAAAAGERPVEYAEALLAWAKTASGGPPGLAALSLWERPHTLSRRVKMVLDPNRSPARPVTRATWTLLIGFPAALVAGLSLCTLHPLTAQDDAPRVRKYIQWPAKPARVPAPENAAKVPVTQIQIDLIVMGVDRAKLAAAQTTLEDAIAQATDSRCRREAGLVVADVQPEEVGKLLASLKKHDAVKVHSEPSIVTLDGREAHVHVGGEAPLLQVEETVNGRHERRVEYKEFGTLLTLRPKLVESPEGRHVSIDLLAELASFLPPGKLAAEGDEARDIPGLVSHKFKLTSEVTVGGSLLVAESPQRAQDKEHRESPSQFLLVVSPKRAIRADVAVYADPAQGEKAENAKSGGGEQLPPAATAAEPEPGTAAAALLQAERDARRKEAAAMLQQIKALESQLAQLREKSPATIPENQSPADARNPLQRNLAEADIAEARLELERAEKAFARIQQLKEQGTVSDAVFDEKRYELEHAKIQLRRAEANMLAAASGAEPAPARASTADPQTEVRLLELDLAEAKVELEVAEAELAQGEEIKQKSPGAISNQELRRSRLSVERAKIQVQRATLQLEAAQSRLRVGR